jgi:hypothetical protein
VARTLVVLFWHLLTKEQDYAFGRPSLTRTKLRQLELAAGAARGKASPVSGAPTRRCARRSSNSLVRPKPPTAASSATGSPKGAGATAGCASSRPSSGKQRGRASVPDPALARRRPRHPELSQGAPKQVQPKLDSHPSRIAILPASSRRLAPCSPSCRFE